MLATLVGHLDREMDHSSILLYLSCSSTRDDATRSTPTPDYMCNTLLYLLHSKAMETEKDMQLLQDCNKAFDPPKSDEKD